MSTPSVDWHEWFDKSKKSLFDAEMENCLEFYLRNGLYKSVYRKWIREKLMYQHSESEIKEEDINEVVDEWLATKKIDPKSFEEEPLRILEENYMNKKLFDQYCK